MNNLNLLQALTIFFTLSGAICSMLAGFKAQPLIPAYKPKFRAIYDGLINPNNRLKELVSHLLEELEKTNINKIEITPTLHARLKNLEESIKTSNERLSEEIGNIFDESSHKANIRILYFVSFFSIAIALLLQAIIIYKEMNL